MKSTSGMSENAIVQMGNGYISELIKSSAWGKKICQSLACWPLKQINAKHILMFPFSFV